MRELRLKRQRRCPDSGSTYLRFLWLCLLLLPSDPSLFPSDNFWQKCLRRVWESVSSGDPQSSEHYSSSFGNGIQSPFAVAFVLQSGHQPLQKILQPNSLQPDSFPFVSSRHQLQRQCSPQLSPSSAHSSSQIPHVSALSSSFITPEKASLPCTLSSSSSLRAASLSAVSRPRHPLQSRMKQTTSVRAMAATASPETTTHVKVHEIFMPALSSTMKEGKIVQWSKRIGERVEVGDTVMVVESDKADMDVEAFSEGYMALQLTPAGETALVGATVGLLAENPEDIQAVQQQGLSTDIPPGDSRRHDGTAAWSVTDHGAATPSVQPSSLPFFSTPPPAAFLPESDRIAVDSQEIFMPALSSTMTQGKIAKWLKKEGDQVSSGDIVMVVESDKADMDVESFEDGYLAKILIPAGGTANVGATVALLAKTPEEIDAVRAAGLEGIASGSDKRHDMTTAVYDKSSAQAPIVEPIEGNGTSQEALSRAAYAVPNKEVFMPMLSSTMTEGKITKWHKTVGDKVNEGDILMVVESDKADMDVESFDEGYLGAVLANEGSTVKVGDSVALIVPNVEDIAALQDCLKTKRGIAAPSSAAVSESLPLTTTHERPLISGAAIEKPISTGKQAHVAERIPVFVPESLDQQVSGQLPEGLVGEDLGKTFLKRATSTPEGRAFVEELQKTEKGKEELKRMVLRAQCRQPPSNNLLHADLEGRKQSVWRISGYARGLAAKMGVDLDAVVGSGPGGRIFAEDVERTAAESKGASWGREAYAQQKAALKSRSVVSSTRPSAISLPASASSPPHSTSAWKSADEATSATPTARQLAKQHKLDIKSLQGTGTFNRVTADDVRRHVGLPAPSPSPTAASSPASIPKSAETESVSADALPPVPASESIPLDATQKAIAKNMGATLSVPVFRVSYPICMDAFDKLQQELKPKGVTVSALLAKAAAIALRHHPLINASFDEKAASVVNPGHINIAMAVATDGGLITPVLRDADTKDIYTLSRSWKDLVNRAKTKSLTRDEYSSGTFVISNLGMFGVSQFEAILPPSVGSILAIGAAIPTVTAEPSGLMGVKKMMVATITSDHRHIYGAHAAEFLKTLADVIENRTIDLLK